MTLETSGSVMIQITSTTGETRDIKLEGLVGDKIQVGFRAKDGDPEIEIGTFTSIIASVAEVLGAGADFQTKFVALLDDMDKIGPLKGVVNQLRNAKLIITDVELKAEYKTDKYEFQSAAFGFRVEFDQLEVGPIKLVGFGVLFEYTKTITGEGVGELKALPH